MEEEPAGGVIWATPGDVVSEGLNSEPTAPQANRPVEVKTTAWSMEAPVFVPPIPAL